MLSWSSRSSGEIYIKYILMQIIEFPCMKVLTGRSNLIGWRVVKKGFMGEQKLSCMWNKKSGLSRGNSVREGWGKSKSIWNCHRLQGRVGGRESSRERVRAQIIKAVWPIAKILALILSVMESSFGILNWEELSPYYVNYVICKVCKDYNHEAGQHLPPILCP